LFFIWRWCGDFARSLPSKPKIEATLFGAASIALTEIDPPEANLEERLANWNRRS
jgi:hypothetical protein